MNLNFNEETTKRIVEGYYKKYEDFDCCLNVECSVKRNHFFGSLAAPTVTTELSFILDGKLEVNGTVEPVRISISQQDVSDAVKTMLQDDGYSIDGINFNCGIDEANKKIGKFNGITVSMSTKRKVKVNGN